MIQIANAIQIHRDFYAENAKVHSKQIQKYATNDIKQRAAAILFP